MKKRVLESFTFQFQKTLSRNLEFFKFWFLRERKNALKLPRDQKMINRASTFKHIHTVQSLRQVWFYEYDFLHEKKLRTLI